MGTDVLEEENVYLDRLAGDPTDVAARRLLGLVRLREGRLPEALELIWEAARLAPQDAQTRLDLGCVLASAGRLTEALIQYDRALEIEPNLHPALYNRALSLQMLGRAEDALASYRELIAKNPRFALAHFNTGILLANMGNLPHALQSFENALAIDPQLADAQNNRGHIFEQLGSHEDAVEAFDAALAINPKLVAALYNRANVLQKMGRFEEALVSYEECLNITNAAEIWNGRGTALRNLDRYREAVQSYDAALSLAPRFGEAAYNRGIVLAEDGRYSEAIVSYDLAIACDAHAPEARRNQGLCHLVLGNFPAGWPLYEWRKKTSDAVMFGWGQGEWTNSGGISGKKLFLHWEQGLGDTIQFSRYASVCEKRGAKIVLSVQDPLIRLFKFNNPIWAIISPCDSPPEFDFHCSLLSLPLAFGTTLDTIPELPRLKAEPALIESWSQKVGSSKPPLIGFAWRGRATHSNDRNRSLPLEQFVSLLDAAGTWLSLQIDPSEEERKLLASLGLPTWLESGNHDFLDTAALIQLTDLVITVDTSVAHLAAAMGKPVWIMLPFNPDWRWLLNRTDTPWYPTAKLFRQHRRGDWSSVIDRLSAELGAFSGISAQSQTP